MRWSVQICLKGSVGLSRNSDIDDAEDTTAKNPNHLKALLLRKKNFEIEDFEVTEDKEIQTAGEVH